jgi:hypothetical protein
VRNQFGQHSDVCWLDNDVDMEMQIANVYEQGTAHPLLCLNAMADGYNSITYGLLLVAVLTGWSYVLNWLGFHSPFLDKLIKSPKLPLVKQGAT